MLQRHFPIYSSDAMDTKHIAVLCALQILVIRGVGADFVLRLAHTNDVHARFEQTNKYGGTCSDDDDDGCYGGVARRHTALQHLRQQAGPNLLYLDAGDQFQGTLWFVYYAGNATSNFMNLLGYDVMALGNHEFDNGVEGLRPFLQDVNFNVISSNIDASNEPLIDGLFKPSVIKEIDGQQIGIVGYTVKTTPELVNPNGVSNLQFFDEITKVQEEVDKLIAMGVNKIIALGHAGYQLDLELAKAVTGVDIVVGGHTDTFLYSGTPPSNDEPAGPYPTIVTQDSGAQVLVVQEFTFGKYLGYLEVTFDDAGVVINYSGNPILLNNESYAQDPDILAEVEKWKIPIFNLTQEVVGTTAVLLDGNRESCRNGECNMGNLLTDAMVYYFMVLFGSTTSSWTNTSIAFWNGGGIRGPISQGDFTVEDVLTTLPFGNLVEKIEITGRTLLDILTHSVSNYNPTEPAGAFLQVSGIIVQYNLATNPPSVVDVQVRCAACQVPTYSSLEMDRVYSVLTSNFLIEGGDGYSMIKGNLISRIPYDTVLSDIVIEFAKQQSPLFPQIEGRIEFVDGLRTCGATSPVSLNVAVVAAVSAICYLLIV